MLAVACSIELHKARGTIFCVSLRELMFLNIQALDMYPATEEDNLRLHMGIGNGLLTCIHVVCLIFRLILH